MTATLPAGAALRSIDGIYTPPPPHWVGDGFRVHGYFSRIPGAVKKLDPFLMLDYHAPHTYEPRENPRGVGVHPHRGFETVTLAWEGSVAHHDSTGAGGIIRPGDVQWMTAASGILHKEYHEAEFARQGGRFHMAQLWVNLPRASKRNAPGYQALSGAQMGIVELADGGGTVRVIAGELAGVRGPAHTFTPVTLLDARLNAGGTLRLPTPPAHNLGVLVMSGEVEINATRTAKALDLVVFKHDGDEVLVTARAPTQLLVMGGEPIAEPIVQYGPFVMNSESEIEEAVRDFHAGKFGFLED